MRWVNKLGVKAIRVRRSNPAFSTNLVGEGSRERVWEDAKELLERGRTGGAGDGRF